MIMISHLFIRMSFFISGSFSGQLGRSGPPADPKLPPAEVELWYSIPGVIPGQKIIQL